MAENDLKLSLIVPVYQVEDYVKQCLDSIVQAECFRDYCELILIDDGSTDGSMAIVKEICGDLPNVTIIRQANAGLGATRNVGLAHARGQYIWFIDSDDEICPDSIIILVDCIRKLSPDVIAFEFVTLGGTLDRARYMAVYDERVDPLAFVLSGRPPSPVQFYAFARKFIDDVALRFESGIYHEDALFTALALVQAESVVRLRKACYRYRLRAGSIMSLSRPEKHLADILFVAEALGERAALSAVGSRSRKALGREVGFALAAARHYAVRTDRQNRRKVAPLSRVALAGRRWRRYFSVRCFINYARLLGLVALRDRLGRI